MTDSARSNLRSAPRALSPLLVNRILTIFDSASGAETAQASGSAPRLRLGQPVVDKVVPIHSTPFDSGSSAIAFLRGAGVSVSVAESSQFGTRWWVFGHPDSLDLSQVIAVAQAKGFARHG